MDRRNLMRELKTLVKWGFVSVDTKARKPDESTHLLRWVHPSDVERNHFYSPRGMITVKVLPDPRMLSTEMFPPW